MLKLFSPFTETWRGFHAYLHGIRWLNRHKRYFLLLMLPMLLGMVLLGAGWAGFFYYQERFFEWVLFDRPEQWYSLAVFYVLKFFLYLSVTAISLMAVFLVINLIASPIYEVVSMAVERDLTGRVEEVDLWTSLKMLPHEFKRILLILVMSLAVLLIPVLNALSIFFAAFFIGWDFYDYSLARRGWTLSRRLRFVMGDFWAVMGLGLWLMIPFIQFLLMPFAVVGGTILSLQRLGVLNNNKV